MKLLHPFAAAALAFWLATVPLAHAAPDPKAARLYEDALTRFEKKDAAGAIVQLKNALQIDKSMLPVHVLLGKALLSNSDVIGAEVAFDEALRLGVNPAEVVVPLAEAVSAQGRPQDILGQPRFAHAGLPADVRARLLVIKAAAAGDFGKPRDALQFLGEARSLEPGRPESWLAEVPIRLRDRQIREAVIAADRAVMLDPASAEAVYLRGSVSHLQGDLKGAAALYDKALALKATHADALISRAGLLLDLNRYDDAAKDIATLRKSSPRDPRGAYLAALLSERAGNAGAARAALNDVTNLLDPVPRDFLRYRMQLLILGGLSHYGLNQLEKAKPYLELAQRQQPGSAVSKLLAQVYLREKNIDRAIESLDSYLRGHPNDTQAMHLLASAHMAVGRNARAASLMQEALKKQDSPSLRTLLGISLIGTGKLADAAHELEVTFQRDPAQIQAGSALASLYLQSGQIARSIGVTEAMLKKQPGNAGLHNLLGTARMRKGDNAGARAAFEQAAKLAPAFMAPLVNLARIDISTKSFDAAVARLNGVLAKEGKNVEALMEMGHALALQGKLEDARRWLEKADDDSGGSLQPGLQLVEFHLAHNRADLARDALKRLLNKQPEALPVLLTQARVQLALLDPAGAKSTLTRAAALANFDPPLLVQVAVLQLRANHVPGAAFALEKALQERPDHLQARAVMTDVEIRQGELGKAEQRARSILASHPKLGLGHSLLGDVALARNQQPAAIDAYRRAHQVDASSESLLRLFSVLTLADEAAAGQLAEQWLKAHPGDVAIRRALADGRARSGNFAAAKGAYEALIKVSPDDAEAINNLANLQVLARDPQALQTAERALALKPEAPHIIGTAGWAAFHAGQPDRALQLLRDARLRDPANPDTRYFLGAVLNQRGRKGEARDELEGALRGPRATAYAKEAQQLLTSLK